MTDTTKGKTFTAAVGVGSCSDWQSGSVDPALLRSSSEEGPTVGLVTGSAENVTTGTTEKKKKGRIKIANSRSQPEDNLSEFRDNEFVDMEVASVTDSDDDARSTASYMSTTSMISVRSISRKRKKDLEDEIITKKRTQEEVTEATELEDESFKHPGSKSPTRKKVIGRIPTATEKTEEELKGMPIEDLKQLALAWLDHIDQARKSSKNLNGIIIKIMKDRTNSIRDIVCCLAEKATGTGDPIYYKVQNTELKAKIKCMERDEGKWKGERNRLEEEIIALGKKNEELEIKLWEMSRNIRTEVQKDVVTGRLDKEWPVLRPQLQGVQKVIPTVTSGQSAAPETKKGKTISKEQKEEVDNIMKELKRLQVKRIQIMEGSKGKERDTETETEGEDNGNRKIKHKYRSKIITKSKSKSESESESINRPVTKPTITSNIQIIPPRNFASTKEMTGAEREMVDEWRTVAGKKGKRRGKIKGKGNMQKVREGMASSNLGQTKVRKPPRTAAVTITTQEGISYAEILRKAREKISLQDVGIEVSKIRKGINGGLIIEIPGNDSTQKANILATKLKDILPEQVKINRPTIKSDIRVSGLDESVTKEEVQQAVANIGECNIAEIRIGEIRWLSNGLGNVWLQCPLITANKIATVGKIKVGWTIAKVEILTPRPLQCYRCWEFGHAKYMCTSKIDRSNLCYNCGNAGHRAQACNSSAPHCVICAEKKLKSNHRLGSNACCIDRQTSRGRPLPRIRREELDTKNASKIRVKQAMEDIPERRTTDAMETDHVIP